MLPSLSAPSTCTGLPQRPSGCHSTYQRLVPAKCCPDISAVTGAPPGCAGRLETKYNRLPSGDNVGSESCHCPENGATSGLVQCPFRRCDTRMVSSFSPKSERMKYKVSPSGVTATEVSCNPVETVPGPINSANGD